jgi:hypothetical protein
VHTIGASLGHGAQLNACIVQLLESRSAPLSQSGQEDLANCPIGVLSKEGSPFVVLRFHILAVTIAKVEIDGVGVEFADASECEVNQFINKYGHPHTWPEG